jgi:hypothetical protein
VDPAIRLKAATEVLDRTLGKPTENVNMNLELAPWQRLMATAIVPTLPGIAEGSIVEGEIVEEPPALASDAPKPKPTRAPAKPRSKRPAK